jgi:hypothetical protein
MYSAEVPMFDRVVSVIVELSDATVLVAGIRPICEHHFCNGITFITI